MKSLIHVLRITLLAALLATTTFSAKPATQVHALGSTIMVDTESGGFPQVSDTRCSLLEAIGNANNNSAAFPDCTAGSGNDRITFADGMGTITLTIDLENITDPDGLTIDGGGDVTIHGNYAHRLFYVQKAPLTLQNLNLFGGYHIDAGGAIYNQEGTLTVINSKFYFNQGYNRGGGAIYNYKGILTVANSIFVQNFSEHPNGAGGAVNVYSGSATFTNNTFHLNKAPEGGDLYVNVGTATLVNNILADSQGGGNCYYSAGTTVLGHHNLIEDPTMACVFVNSMDGNIVGFDPGFGVPDAHDHAELSSTSPAIGAGDDEVCAGYPVNNTSYNGLPRPQGGHCDIGAYEMLQTTPPIEARYYSVPAQDGQILESTETSGAGGIKNTTATTIKIGDDAANKQYRAILSFDTSDVSIPPNAVIISASLWFKDAGIKGKSPFLTHGNLLADVKTGFFGSTSALQLADFKATASKNKVLQFTNLLDQGWYSQYFDPAYYQYINRNGITQFRLRFAKDDNNDFGADYIKIFSSELPNADLPQLIIYYYDR